MKAQLLEELVEAQQQQRARVLATNLDTGEQALLAPLDDRRPASASAGPWPLEEARQALLGDRSLVVETSKGPVFLRAYNPPVRLVVVGAVHVAQSLVPMARVTDFDVYLVDPRKDFATETRFPGVELVHAWPAEALERLVPDHRTAVITLSHDPKLDDPALVAALQTDVFYVGALGSRRTHAARLERLREEGLTEGELAGIHAPIGLDIGARTPAEISISILGEIVERLRKAPPE